jgi:hypothetical protein
MLYLSGLFFALAIALIGADYVGVRAAHDAAVTGTICLILALAFAAAKEVQLLIHHE